MSDDLLPALAAEFQVLGKNKGVVCGTGQNAGKTVFDQGHELRELDADSDSIFERVDSGVFQDIAVAAQSHANVDVPGSGASARVDVQVVTHLSRSPFKHAQDGVAAPAFIPVSSRQPVFLSAW